MVLPGRSPQAGGLVTAEVTSIESAVLRRRLQCMGDAFLLGAAALAYVVGKDELDGYTAFMNEADPVVKISREALMLDSANAAMVLMQLSELTNKRISRLLEDRVERVMEEH